MIKLSSILNKFLIPESQHTDLNDIIIVGMNDYGGGVKSEKSAPSNVKTHSQLGYHRGINWRYNPRTKTVYWWDIDEADPYEKELVEYHLLKKYKFKVEYHVPMVLTPTTDNPDITDTDNYYQDLDTHPFR